MTRDTMRALIGQKPFVHCTDKPFKIETFKFNLERHIYTLHIYLVYWAITHSACWESMTKVFQSLWLVIYKTFRMFFQHQHQ